MEEQAGDSLCCPREEASEDGGIRTLEQEVSEEEAEKMNFKGKWIKIEAEMDTGACVPMMPTSLAKHLKIRESERVTKRSQICVGIRRFHIQQR